MEWLSWFLEFFKVNLRCQLEYFPIWQLCGRIFFPSSFRLLTELSFVLISSSGNCWHSLVHSPFNHLQRQLRNIFRPFSEGCLLLSHLKRPCCWERLRAGGEGDDRGWDDWMASPTQWTWVWVDTGSWWWTGRPGVLQSMGSQRVGHDWATELNWMLSSGIARSCGNSLFSFLIPSNCVWESLTFPGARLLSGL